MKWLLILCCTCKLQMVIAQNVDHLEYFIDTDPGTGNAFAILFTTADTVRLTHRLVPDTTKLAGMHTFYIRARNKAGWGLTESFPFYLASANNSTILTGAEYFIDRDTGTGKAIAISSVIPADTVKLALLLSADNQLPGMHSLNIRFKDEAGYFSLFESFPFFITADVVNMPKIIAAEYFFGTTDPGAGKGIPLNITPGGDTVIRSFIVPVSCINAKVDSNYNLYIRVKDDAGHWGLLEKDTFNLRRPNTVITVKDGLWSDASIWSNNKVPIASTDVVLNHAVTIDINAVCRYLFTFCNIVKINQGKTISITGLP